MAHRTNKIVKWAKSTSTPLKLETLVNSGLLPPQNEIHWRAPKEEIHPQPTEGEIIITLIT